MATSNSQHVIDCSAALSIPEGSSFREEDQIKSRFQGKFAWNPEKIRLHLYFDDLQQRISGKDLLKKLEGQPVLPAKVGEYLFAHPELIPLNWRGKCIFFWGTVYRRSEDDRCVWYLLWNGTDWDWRSSGLGPDWHSGDPAAVLAP